MEDNNEKKIFSFNKAAYIISNTDCGYNMGIDPENLNTYFIFEDNKEISKAIYNFNRADCICFNFRKFLNTYSTIREESKKLKAEYLKGKSILL